MRRFLPFFISVFLIVPCFSMNVVAVSTSATSAVVINADTMTVIYESNGYTKLPMASTTKIMTALILAEQNSPEKTVVTTPEMVNVEGSSMGLLVGDTVTYRDLLYGLLLASGNDAANTVAISVGGSLEGFADLMNKKASEIGLQNTHFVTPSGLDDKNHYTTAYDLAVLAAYALKNSEFAAACSSKSAVLEYGNPPYRRSLTNHNKLLKLYDGAIGVKTGYTSSAGRCLVSAARRDGKTVIAVTLNDKNDWQDHQALLDYGFENITSCVIQPDFPTTLSLVGGNADSIKISYEPLQCGVCNGDKIGYEVVLPNFVYAPVNVGDVVGRADYYIGDRFLCSKSIISAETIGCSEPAQGLHNKIFRKFILLFRSL